MAVSENELLELTIKQTNGIKLTKEEKKILKENSQEEKEKKKSMSIGQRLKYACNNDDYVLLSEDDSDKFETRDFFSTSNILLNVQISGDWKLGMPSNRIWIEGGIYSSSKTYIMLETAKNAMKKGYHFVLIETEGSTTKDELIKRGFDISNISQIHTESVEESTDVIMNILEEATDKDKIFIGIDSIGGMTIDEEVDNKDNQNFARGKKIRSLFRKITKRAAKKNIPIIAITHVYKNIMGHGNSLSGGDGGMFAGSIVNEYTKAQHKDGDEITGSIITSTLIKGRLSKEKTKIKYNLLHDSGLKLTSGLFEYCVDEEIFVKEKLSYKINTKKTGDLNFKKDEVFTKQKMDNQFWKEFLHLWLGEYLNSQFKYQSSTDGILEDDDLTIIE